MMSCSPRSERTTQGATTPRCTTTTSSTRSAHHRTRRPRRFARGCGRRTVRRRAERSNTMESKACSCGRPILAQWTCSHASCSECVVKDGRVVIFLCCACRNWTCDKCKTISYCEACDDGVLQLCRACTRKSPLCPCGAPSFPTAGCSTCLLPRTRCVTCSRVMCVACTRKRHKSRKPIECVECESTRTASATDRASSSGPARAPGPETPTATPESHSNPEQ